MDFLITDCYVANPLRNDRKVSLTVGLSLRVKGGNLVCCYTLDRLGRKIKVYRRKR